MKWFSLILMVNYYIHAHVNIAGFCPLSSDLPVIFFMLPCFFCTVVIESYLFVCNLGLRLSPLVAMPTQWIPLYQQLWATQFKLVNITTICSELQSQQ